MDTPTGIDKKHIISRHFLFSQMSPTEVDKILAFSVEKTYQDGQIIFSKGDEGNSMMIVLAGRVLISVISEEAREITLNYIEPGGILGELALIDGNRRSANATAVGACLLLHIARSEFIAYLRQNPDVSMQLMRVLCEKLRKTSDMAENIGLLPVPARLAKLVLRLAQPDGARPDVGTIVTLKLSQREMGNLIGSTRETVNRTLRQWHQEGLIILKQSQLTILKPKELSWITECST